MQSPWWRTFGIIVAFISFLLAGIPMFMHPATAFTGLHVARGFAASELHVESVDAGSPAAIAGIRAGDHLGCMSYLDEALVDATFLGQRAYGYTPGHAVSLCVRSGDTVRTVQFTPLVRPPAPSLYGNDVGAALRLSEFAIFLACGVLLVYGKPGRMSWIFFAYTLGAAPNASGYINLTVLPTQWYELYVVVCQTLDFIASGFLLMFTLLVPDDRLTGWRRPVFTGAALLTAASAVYEMIMLALFEVDGFPAVYRFPEVILALLTLTVVVLRLVTMPPEVRARFGWAAFAIVWGVTAEAIAHGSISLGGHSSLIAASATAVVPLAMLYAVLRQHLIDLRFVLSRTIVYAVITTLIVAIIGVVDWLTAQYLHESRFATLADAGVTIGVAMLLHRTYAWIEHAVEFVLFRKKYEAEAYLERLSRAVLAADRPETIDRDLVEAPVTKLHLNGSVLYRLDGSHFLPERSYEQFEAPPFDADAELIRFLKAERRAVHLRDVGTLPAGFADSALAIPVQHGRTLDSFVIYGYHRNGTALDPDEVEALERLCDAAARSYINIELDTYKVYVPFSAPV